MDAVRLGQRLAEAVLEDLAGGGVATGLEGRDEGAARVSGAQGLEGEGDGGRVMAEVLDDHEVGTVDQHLLAAADALEGRERR